MIWKEMDHWWKRREEVDRGDYTKDEVEDLTGRIPLLLENCLLGGKINLKAHFFTEICLQVTEFEKGIQSNCNRPELLQYATLVLLTQLR